MNNTSPLPIPPSLVSSVVSPDHKRRRAKKEEELDPEESLYLQILAKALPIPTRQLVFAKAFKRRFRFDFSWGEPYMLALEVEGGVWIQGRHTRGSGFVKDIVKYNLGNLLGFHIYRVTSAMVKDGTAIALVEEVLKKASERTVCSICGASATKSDILSSGKTAKKKKIGD